jgi:hypothetical protein
MSGACLQARPTASGKLTARYGCAGSSGPPCLIRAAALWHVHANYQVHKCPPHYPQAAARGRWTRAPEGHALQRPVAREGDQAARQHGRLRLGLLLEEQLALPGHHLLARPREPQVPKQSTKKIFSVVVPTCSMSALDRACPKHGRQTGSSAAPSGFCSRVRMAASMLGASTYLLAYALLALSQHAFI